MHKKLPIGSGLARAKRNRSRGPRTGAILATGFNGDGTPCHDCGVPLEQVDDCTCIVRPTAKPNAARDAFLGMAALRLRKSALRHPRSAIARATKGARA